MVIALFLGFGTLIIVSLIDENKVKLMKYQIDKWKGSFSLNKNNPHQLNTNNKNKEHEENLREVFDKNFKERSNVDSSYLKYIEEYVDEKIMALKGNQNKESA